MISSSREKSTLRGALARGACEPEAEKAEGQEGREVRKSTAEHEGRQQECITCLPDTQRMNGHAYTQVRLGHSARFLAERARFGSRSAMGLMKLEAVFHQVLTV